jgi:hypothetical protein
MFRVNSSLVLLPRCLPIELSLVLGTIIANRLATNEAGPWRKALTALVEFHAQMAAQNKVITMIAPEVPWPLDAVLWVYPGKRAYGRGELIVWELKLLGESTDHGLFLELILPAMEEAGYTSDTQWNRSRSLWGHFDIEAVLVARGAQWEPLVKAGKLDLRYRPTPMQWAEGLAFAAEEGRALNRLTWLTPFDFEGIFHHGPTLQVILEALLLRASRLILGRHKTRDDLMTILNTVEQATLQKVLEEAARAQLHENKLGPSPKNWPGARIGAQIFAPIPSAVIRYLELASILHVGKYTHFGCGTFVLS